MKKYKHIFLLLFSSVLLFTACSKDALEIPQKGVITMESFYKTDADAKSALVDTYKDFAQNIGGNDGIYVPYDIVFNYCADNVLAAGEYYGDNDQFASINEFRFDAQSDVISKMYSRLYFVIYHANLVIDHFKYGESAVKDQCISEARVIRAWCHMMAAMGWGAPPLMEHIIDGATKPTNYEGGHDALLKWCAKECEDAAKYLPERTSPSDKDGAVKVTKGFALTVQGKALLYVGDYAGAKVPLKAVITSGKYKLVSGDKWRDLFHIQGDGCEEKVFESNLINSSSIGDWSGKIQRSTWMEMNLMGWRTSRLASQPKTQGDQGWGGLGIEETFANEFAANDGDSYRRKATLITYDEFVTDVNSVKWTSDSIARTRDYKLADKDRGIKDVQGLYGQCGYLQKKLIVAPEDRTTNWYRFNNFIIERYADVLLMYAEACAQTNDNDGLTYLQEVQRRAGATVHVSDALTMDEVKRERNYELWMEGSRWIDMKRWGEFDKAVKAGTHIPSLKDAFIKNESGVPEAQHRGYVTYSEPNAGKKIGFEKGKSEYFPYPYSETSINPNIKQNPGW